MKILAILAPVILISACAPLLPYERASRAYTVYEPKVKFNRYYNRYQYVCKRGDVLVRHRGRTVCYDR